MSLELDAKRSGLLRRMTGFRDSSEDLAEFEAAVRADQREKDAAEILALVDTMCLDPSMRAGIRKAAATLRGRHEQ